MSTENAIERIAEARVVPVIAIEDADRAIPLADALIAGGLPVIEITFRTEAAADVIHLLSRERPELLVGAGTVLTPANAQRAHDCGAAFAVSPGLNPAVVRAAQECELLFAPGIMTPSDVEAALGLGISTMKYFPAEAIGGVRFLKSMAAPFKHLNVRFIPTGGVKPGNLADYLAEPSVVAAGGTWIAKSDVIAAGDWDTVTANCREARQIANA